MKTVSAELEAHLAGDVTTLATCWRIERTDGHIYGFTDCSRDLVIDELTYLASSGISASNVRDSASLDVDNLEVESVLDDDTITEADLLAGLWSFAAVDIIMVNYADLTMGTLPVRSGTLGEVRCGRQRFSAEMRGLTQSLQQGTGRAYGIDCDADLGDARCGVDLEALRVTGTISLVTDTANFIADDLTQPGEYFNYGQITWLTGDNAGLSMEVKAYAGAGVFALQLPMPYVVEVGDTFTAVPGCDKRKATCRDTYSNVVNFRGFAEIPGTDRLMAGT